MDARVNQYANGCILNKCPVRVQFEDCRYNSAWFEIVRFHDEFGKSVNAGNPTERVFARCVAFPQHRREHDRVGAH